jgi:hypothetical protein
MMRSHRQQQKRRKDILGIIGMISILAFGGGGYYFFSSNSDPLDANNCSIKNGPKAVTAIVFDKSQKYSERQVNDIQNSFELWLTGKEASTKNRPIELDFFSEGNLLQLYVTDNHDVNSVDGLRPRVELCVPADFKNANALIQNPGMMEATYQDFLNQFSIILKNLLQTQEGTTPLLETFVGVANSKSFQMHDTKQHNMFIISDMLQSSKDYDHYGQGVNWQTFEQTMAGTVYLRTRLNDVKWQVFLAKREGSREKALQTTELTDFWEEFFFRAGSSSLPWILIDG